MRHSAETTSRALPADITHSAETPPELPRTIQPRRYQRGAFSIPVCIQQGSHQTHGKTVDFTPGGLRLLCRNAPALAPGSALNLTFQFGQTCNLTTAAQVAYCLESSHDETHTMGIRFAGLRDWEQTIMLSALKELSESDQSRQASLITIHISESALAHEAISLATETLREQSIEKATAQDAGVPPVQPALPVTIATANPPPEQHLSAIPVILQLRRQQTISCQARNLSPQGMIIASSAALAPDVSLAVTFALGGSCSLPLAGQVTSCLSENGTQPAVFTIGITFCGIEEDEQFILLSLLKDLREPRRALPKLAISLVTLDEELTLDSPATPHGSRLAPAVHKRIRTVTTRRVVITGIGAVAPNGIGREAFWRGLANGKNCISRITSFDPEGHPSQIAAEIHGFDPQAFIEAKEIKRMGRSAHLAVAAAQQAIDDAKLQLTPELKSSVGTIVGTGTSGLEYAEYDFYALREGGVRRMRPYAAIAGFGGALSSEVSRALGLTGRSITISTGCTGSTDAIGEALQLIRYGAAEILLAGGADAPITPGILGAFCQIGAVCTSFNGNPHKASRPFNKDRDGFVLGEGAWMFVLEELNHALRRDATIYAEVIGYAATCDAFHMSRPLPSGEHTASAMKLAINDAMIQPYDIDYIAAYGNATPVNDSYETMVIKNVFGPHASRLLVSSIKSMIGHPIGSCGAGQLAAALMAISTGIVPPTINYEIPDPECDLDYVPNTARVAEVRTALCNTLAFGSKNAVLVVRRFDPHDDM